MKIFLRLLTLLGLVLAAMLYWGEEGLAHLLFPSVPDDISLSPQQVDAGLDFEQCLLGLAVTIIISLILFLLFRRMVLPKMSAVLLNWMTGQDSCYSSEDDELMQILEHLGSTPTREDLQPLASYCAQHPKRLRGWTEYANLLRLHFQDAPAAIKLLRQAHDAVADAEDKALILYRIAGIYERELKQPEEAKAHYAEAADCYPQCSYGKLAASKR
ncbi:MAG: hypothetical protein R3Y56_05405 [Akkermansia sp.]